MPGFVNVSPAGREPRRIFDRQTLGSGEYFRIGKFYFPFQRVGDDVPRNLREILSRRTLDRSACFLSTYRGTVAIRCTSITRRFSLASELGARDGILCYVLFGGDPRVAAFIKGFAGDCARPDTIAVSSSAGMRVAPCRATFHPSDALRNRSSRDSLPSRRGSSLIITEILMAAANGFSRAQQTAEGFPSRQSLVVAFFRSRRNSGSKATRDDVSSGRGCDFSCECWKGSCLKILDGDQDQVHKPKE